MISREEILNSLPAWAFHWKIIVSCFALLVFSLPFVSAVFSQQPDVASEGEIKAAFIYNFIKFVEWPTSAFSTTEQRIIICVLGQDGVSRALEKVSGKITQGRTITIKHAADPTEMTQFHVVYVGQSEKDHMRTLIKAIPKHVLTISDTQSFAASGGMINFYTVERKVSFVINLDAAERAGLKLSSQLLRLARIVKETGF
jgi:hypothetical protein